MIAFEAAYARILDDTAVNGLTETLPLNAALHRIVAEDQVAQIDVPGYDNSAMDGYAVCCREVVANEPLAVSQRITAGDVAAKLSVNSVARIFTGAMVPQGADAIVLQEDSVVDNEGVRFTEPPEPGQHIRRAGQDVGRGSVVVRKGERLTAAKLGLLASVGVASLACFQPVRVALFSTGDELVDPGEPLCSESVSSAGLNPSPVPIDNMPVVLVPPPPSALRANR